MPYQRHKADRKKAMVMVAALHAALGAALVLGLAGAPVQQVADPLRNSKLIEPLNLEPPPPPPPPPPRESAPAPRDEAAPPNLRARPAPIVAPAPLRPLPVRSPVRTSERRAPVEGADRSAGAAAVAGPGTGAGGSGDGFGGGGLGGEGGGGGTGTGTGSAPRLLGGNSARVSQRLLQQFADNRGEALLALTIGAHGRVTACAPIRGSGNADLDVELCRLMLSRSRWVPALDGSGRPISAQLQYTATWNRY
uniref:energy transducer TonB n=1 Tax=uncultured Sphingomonas sp. TaxID=158754 RepID=UPI0025F80DA7|nr:hypothetical protein [uncultured Sphingomonas sp.]